MFSEFGTRQDLNRREFAFGHIFGLDFVSNNVYAQYYQNIRTVQELGPVSFFFLILTSAKPRQNCSRNDNW